VRADRKVNVSGENAAGMNGVSALPNSLSEAFGDREGLTTREANGRVFK
jgi:pyruvate/2-oxoglutarate/acetoin dehydrogenase E1 component